MRPGDESPGGLPSATVRGLRRRIGAAASDDDCGWLFLDTSHRHNRRWCSAADCGNRARVRRFYERRSSGGRQLSRAGG
ncbi:CGNR zinc finger domain-containing protein [Mycobacterium sp. ACS4054]|uniref:CGNR zinc finger domain-containing protein n=1 Tax=Mycobacterium sp. ACS4054 TaxID=1834119 RepID=UPI0009EED4B0